MPALSAGLSLAPLSSSRGFDGRSEVGPQRCVDAVQRGDRFTFVYTGRTRDSMPFINELQNLLGNKGIHLWPDDECGVPDAARIIDLAPQGAALYACGPTPMIEAIRAHIPNPQIDTLHYERFSPPVLGGKTFALRLAHTGTRLRVEADKSALRAVRRVCPDQACSCQQGFCGTCKVRVQEGRVEHRDKVLTDDERADRMILCVSRGTGTVTIEA